MSRFTKEVLDELFTYHAPSEGDVVAYAAIRSKARELAETIIAHTPASADQTAAIRYVRTAVMTANASIATKGVG